MSITLNLKTRVLPGKRIEITAPELYEGQVVDVQVTLPDSEAPARDREMSMVEFLESLPLGRKTPEEWEQFERAFQAERDSWDR